MAYADGPGFVPYRPPPPITELTDDDERILAALEAEWSAQRGPLPGYECDDAGDDGADDAYYTPPPPDAAKVPQGRRWGLPMDALVSAAAMDVDAQIDRPTLIALMAAAGHLTHLPRERRYILSRDAIAAGIGRNVLAQGGRTFPVIYPEHVPMVLRSLAWPWIVERMAALPDQRARRRFAVETLAHLPVATLVRLSGVPKRTIERDLARHREERAALAPTMHRPHRRVVAERAPVATSYQAAMGLR